LLQSRFLQEQNRLKKIFRTTLKLMTEQEQEEEEEKEEDYDRRRRLKKRTILNMV